MSVTDVVEIAGVVLSVGAIVLGAGAALARLSSHEARINKLERGAEDQGRRIGDLAAKQEAQAAETRVDREYRRSLTGSHKSGE
jgi:hypothetical protein